MKIPDLVSIFVIQVEANIILCPVVGTTFYGHYLKTASLSMSSDDSSQLEADKGKKFITQFVTSWMLLILS